MRAALSVLLAGLVLAYGSTVMARGDGGRHQDGMGGGHHGNPGGIASDHMSSPGIENSNAQWGTGSTRGQERSRLRHQEGRGSGHGPGAWDAHGNHGHGKHNGHENGGKNKSHKGNGGGKDHRSH
ncbi:MAG: hypothetical protein H0X43_12035 [Nitrosospira sp.]|nr:hypothetical protein [Nitrosospira sp.]